MPLNKQTDQELSDITRLLTCWNRDWDNARPYFDDAAKDYLAYKMYRNPNSHPYKYNPVIPLVFTITENIVSTVFNNFFMKDNPLTITPVETTHLLKPNILDEKIAKQLEKVINVTSMHPDREFVLEKYDLDMETVIFGNGYTTCVPDFDFKQTSEMGGPVYVGPRVMHLSFWDLIPDREAYRLSTSAGCRRIWLKEWINEEEYKRRVENASYKKLSDDDLKKLTYDKTWIPEDFHRDLLSKLGKGARPEDGIDEKNGTILLLHYYDMYSGHYKTIAGNRILIRDTSIPQMVDTPAGPIKVSIPPYPYCPYDDLRLWPFPKEFFASGVGRIVRGFQEDINLMKSMRLENIEVSLFKTFLVNDMFVEEPDEIMMMPGGINIVKDINNSIKVLEVGNITEGSYVEQGQWEKEAQDASSSQETVRGNQPTRRETATTVVQLQRNSMKRIESFMKRVSFWYKSVSRKKAIQIRTYMSQNEYERILGEPDAGFYQLRLVEIQRLFDFQPSSSSLDQVREIDQQNFVQALQMAQGAPEVMNIPEWMKLGFELFFPTRDPNKYILAAPPQQPPVPGGPPPESPSGQTPYGQPTITPSQLIDQAAQGQLGS